MSLETPYIISIIRTQERSFLGADEYTRMIEAATLEDTLRVLIDTPYGQWLEPHNLSIPSVLAALEERLVVVQRWLAEVLDKPTVIQWLQLKYDALNIVTALLAFHEGALQVPPLSRLGAMNSDTLFSVIWNNVGWEAVPDFWQPLIQEGRSLVPDNFGLEWKSELVSRVQNHVMMLQQTLAQTPLMKKVSLMFRDRLVADTLVREKLEGGLVYEKMWDEKIIDLFRPTRWEPVGYDPIIAFWLALQFEVVSIRLIIAGKLQAADKKTLNSFIRNIYANI